MSIRNNALAVFVNHMQNRRRNGQAAQAVGSLRAVHRPTRNATNAQRLENTYRLSTARALRNPLYMMCIEAISHGNTVGYNAVDRSGNLRYLEIYPRFHLIENNEADQQTAVPIGTLKVYVSDGPDRTRGMMFLTQIFNEHNNVNYRGPEARWSRASSRRARSRLSGLSLGNDLFTTDILTHLRFHPRTQQLALSMRFTPTDDLYGITHQFA